MTPPQLAQAAVAKLVLQVRGAVKVFSSGFRVERVLQLWILLALGYGSGVLQVRGDCDLGFRVYSDGFQGARVWHLQVRGLFRLGCALAAGARWLMWAGRGAAVVCAGWGLKGGWVAGVGMCDG